MPLLLTCRGLGKSFGSKALFADLALTISEGDRLGVIGPNGTGKSTLLRILAGDEEPDQGEVVRSKRLRASYVPQESEFEPGALVGRIVANAICDPRVEDFEKATRARICLGRVGMDDPETPAGSLSGGFRKRLAIAAALANRPDLLLLDEPTNHLDIEGILWLEEFLADAPFASLAVSHDRYFLENFSNRMMEVNPAFPGGLLVHDGGYRAFLEAKERMFEVEGKREKSLAIKARRERDYLAQGPKARSSKAKHRKETAEKAIRDLERMRRRRRTSAAEVGFTGSGVRSKELLVAESLSKSLGGRPLFQDLDVLLSPGLKLGLAGPNGSGKTTLLKCLAGELEPDGGRIRRKSGLKAVYFDQHRERLDPGQRLGRALAPSGGDAVVHRGRSIHVNAWAERFLFRREQLEMPVSRLSGGERARLLIARLMLREADVLLLDEPTNDLDIPTLEVLEEGLRDFPGALVLVTHDRYLLDRVANLVLGLDGRGGSIYVADYWQWEREKRQRERCAQSEDQSEAAPKREAEAKRRDRPRKLSYRDKMEWEKMEERILEAESELESRREAVEDPEVASDPEKLQSRWAALREAQRRVERLYERWSELEAKIVP